MQGNCIWEVLQAKIYRKSKVCVLTGWFLMVNGEPSVMVGFVSSAYYKELGYLTLRPHL